MAKVAWHFLRRNSIGNRPISVWNRQKLCIKIALEYKGLFYIC